MKKYSEEEINEIKKLKNEKEIKEYMERNNIQLPDDILNKISGGSDDGYTCDDCGARFNSLWDYLSHVWFEHWTD